MNRGGIADAILGGWTTTGFWIIHQAGSPMTIATNVNSANLTNPPVGYLGDFTGARPSRICDGRLDNPTTSKYFDTACFAAPENGTFGNSGDGIIMGPGRWGGDAGIYKYFNIKEDIRLQFRTEMFNTFNKVNNGYPGTAWDVPQTFGVITTREHSPRVIQLALRLTF